MGVIGSSPTNPTKEEGPSVRKGPFALVGIIEPMTTGPHDRGGKREKRQPGGLSAKRKRLEFVSAKGSMKPAPRASYDH